MAMEMSLDQLCWLATAAYAIHVLEEFVFNWRDWARNVLHLPAEWGDFYITNAVVIVLGIVAAETALSLPMIALAFPALMLVNATFFHVMPFLVKKGRFSPGLITALLLFYPIGIAGYRIASRSGVLSFANLWGSVLLGALLMATPIIFLKLKDRPYFLQD
jgi:Protein of unknown function with HXXEE motif